MHDPVTQSLADSYRQFGDAAESVAQALSEFAALGKEILDEEERARQQFVADIQNHLTE